MSTYASIYLNGEILCAVHYDGYLSDLGASLLNLVNKGYYNWKDILDICKEYTLVFIHLKYVREDYFFCYQCAAYKKKQFYWPKEPTSEFLDNGTPEDEERDPITNEFGYGMICDYDYNIVGDKLFVRTPMEYKEGFPWGLVQWFPWVLVDEKLIFDESKLDDIYCEIYGVLEISEIDYEISEKIGNDGPINAGINLLRASKYATEYMPWDPKVWITYGGALKANGNVNGSINAFKKAIELEPNNPYIWWIYGEVLENYNMKAQALASYSKTTQLLPNDYRNWEKYVDKLKNMNENEKLIESYKKMIDILESESKHIINLKKLGKLYIKINRKEKAINTFKELILKIIKFDSISRIYYHLEKLREFFKNTTLNEIIPFLNNTTQQAFNNFLLKNPNDPEIFYYLGKFYIGIDELDNANKAWKKLISIVKETKEKEGVLPYNLKIIKDNLIILLKKLNLKNLLEELTFDEKISELELKFIHDLENYVGKPIKVLEEIKDYENIGYKIQNNHITILKISKCDIKSLPESINYLTFLEVLYLRSNKITTLPNSIGDLKNLRELILPFNDINTLPNSIGKLENLEKLDLSYNKNLAILPNSMKSLKNLKELNINNTRLNPIPEVIWKLASLEILHAKYLKISEISESISNLISLKELDLSSNNLETIPDSIGKLSKLEKLNLSYNKNLISLPKSTEKLRSLTILNLSSTNLKSDPEIGEKIKSIKESYPEEYFNSSKLNILNALMKKLILNLEEIYSNYNQLPDFIGNLKSLKELYLENLKLSKLPNSIKNLISLEKLNLARNKFSLVPEAISNFKSLKELDLSNNEISSLPKFIFNLENLVHLSISSNRITIIPETIGNLRNLEKLRLNNNKITELPESIGNLRNLEELHLNYNKITELPESIGNLKSLKKLDFSHNNLKNLPSSLLNLNSLYWIELYENYLDLSSDTIKKLREKVSYIDY
ncbi:MAG: leucine-rich repeat domain-containing protein [Candidatus Helarchaeota archaeon]